MSLIGIAAVHAGGRSPADLTALPNGNVSASTQAAVVRWHRGSGVHARRAHREAAAQEAAPQARASAPSVEPVAGAGLDSERGLRLPRLAPLERHGHFVTSSYVRETNFLNAIENNADWIHVAFVHGRSGFADAGVNRELPTMSAEETPYAMRALESTDAKATIGGAAASLLAD